MNKKRNIFDLKHFYISFNTYFFLSYLEEKALKYNIKINKLNFKIFFTTKILVAFKNWRKR